METAIRTKSEYDKLKNELQEELTTVNEGAKQAFQAKLNALNMVFNMTPVQGVAEETEPARPRFKFQRKRRQKRAEYGDLTSSVLGIIQKLGDKEFTVADVKKGLGLRKAAPSISATLWRLSSEKKLSIVTQGAGRKATIYKSNPKAA